MRTSYPTGINFASEWGKKVLLSHTKHSRENNSRLETEKDFIPVLLKLHIHTSFASFVR